MSKTVEIQVKEKTFKLGFSLGVFMELGERWGFDTLEEVMERIQGLLSFADNKISFSAMKVLYEILEVMISSHPDNKELISAKELSFLDIGEFELIMSQLVAGFVQNMPQPEVDETEKKPKPRAKK